MNKNVLIIFILIIILIGGGIYWAQTNSSDQTPPLTSGENPRPGDQVHGLPPEPAAAVARKDLASKLSVSEGSIVILEVADTTWNDGCLGLGGPAESCLQALVPGFKVTLQANGKTYIYRTNKTGDVLRAETQM